MDQPGPDINDNEWVTALMEHLLGRCYAPKCDFCKTSSPALGLVLGASTFQRSPDDEDTPPSS